MLDGQTIPLEDYLAVYPEKEELLRERISQGKIVPGPWYTVPDTAIPCGEGLIRNLQEGQALCSRFGGGLNTAYTPDTFGLASQMPQIYRLFGFERSMFTRGIWDGIPGSRPNLLHWEGADGSEILTLQTDYNDAVELMLESVWKSFDREAPTYENCKKNFDKLMEQQEKNWKSSVRFGIVGIDHMEPVRELQDLVRQLQEDYPEYEIHLGTMDEFFDLLAEEAPELFVTVHGEQRSDPNLTFPHTNTASTRADLKDLIRSSENRLQYLCGPLSAFYPVKDEFNDIDTDPFCHQAWRLLTACQAHDSICMCNTDPTNEDVARRLHHANQMSREAEKILQQRLGENIAPIEESAAALVVYNPLPFTRSIHVKGAVCVPYNAPGMRLVTADGTPVKGAVFKETFRKRVTLKR